MLGAFYYARYDRYKRSDSTLEILLLALLSENIGIKISSSYYTSFTLGHDIFLTAEVFDPIPNKLEIANFNTITIDFQPDTSLKPTLKTDLFKYDFRRTIKTQFRDELLEEQLLILIKNTTMFELLQTKFRTGSRKPLGIYQPTEIYFAIPHILREEITIQEFENIVKNSLEKVIELSKKD